MTPVPPAAREREEARKLWDSFFDGHKPAGLRGVPIPADLTYPEVVEAFVAHISLALATRDREVERLSEFEIWYNEALGEANAAGIHASAAEAIKWLADENKIRPSIAERDTLQAQVEELKGRLHGRFSIEAQDARRPTHPEWVEAIAHHSWHHEEEERLRTEVEKSTEDFEHIRVSNAALTTETLDLRTQVDAKEATIMTVVSAIGGQVEGQPTSRVNFLQRVWQLRNAETALAREKAIRCQCDFSLPSLFTRGRPPESECAYHTDLRTQLDAAMGELKEVNEFRAEPFKAFRNILGDEDCDDEAIAGSVVAVLLVHKETGRRLREARANLLALQVEHGRVRGALEEIRDGLTGVANDDHPDDLLDAIRFARRDAVNALSSPVPAAEVGEAVRELITQATLAHRGECPTVREDGTCGGCRLNDALTALRTLGLGPQETSR